MTDVIEALAEQINKANFPYMNKLREHEISYGEIFKLKTNQRDLKILSVDEQIETLRLQHDTLQVGLQPDEMAIRDNIILKVGEGAYDSYPRYGFQFFTFRSPEMVAEMSAFVKYAKEKKFFWDIGSFHGLFALVFSKINLDSIAIAFEPFKEPFEVLRRTFAMNKGSNNLLACPEALSNKNGFVYMAEKDGHCVEDEGGTLQISCLQGDIMAEKFNIPPDLLKIDTEGMELKVLEGLYGIISRYHPTIFLELHLSQLSKEELNSIFSLLKEWNYKMIDTSNEQEITEGEIKTKTGELRVICL